MEIEILFALVHRSNRTLKRFRYECIRNILKASIREESVPFVFVSPKIQMTFLLISGSALYVKKSFGCSDSDEITIAVDRTRHINVPILHDIRN